MTRKGLLFIPIILLCFALKSDFWDESINARARNIPPDMIFIQGNDSISSFYIGKMEECNRNYLIYLEWLRRVFYPDYPEVYFAALPDTSILVDEFNDPYSQNYFRHLAFSYYPIVGVSWIQAQKYCHWKSDRYNENLLINEGFLRFNPNQINEDNFNTEAWLSYQYEGIKKRNILLPEKMDTSEALYSLHLLVPEFRLPTEAEWELATYFSQKLETKSKDIFTNNYFLNTWKKNYEADNSKQQTVVFDDSTTTFLKSNFVSDVRGNSNISHMDDNVHEWVYDVDFGNNTPIENDLIKAYSKSYQPFADSISRDGDGYYREKDSLGRMIYEYLCDDKNGKPIQVLTYPTVYNDTVNPVKRIYRGGTNLKRGTNIRSSLSEHACSAKLGFRCAMTIIKD